MDQVELTAQIRSRIVIQRQAEIAFLAALDIAVTEIQP
jgi:hypothetical protein